VSDEQPIAALQERVEAELARYEHPLLRFGTRMTGDGRLQLTIDFIEPRVPVHQYVADLHPRDLNTPQLAWTLQRILYDCLHDYLVEMFVRTPQSRP
jgi:hypothetical protein